MSNQLVVLVVMFLCLGVAHASSRGVARELLQEDTHAKNKTLPSVSYVSIRFDSSSPVENQAAAAQSQSGGIGSWLERKKNKFTGGGSSGSQRDESPFVEGTASVDQSRDVVSPVSGVSAATGGSGQMDEDEALWQRQQLLEQLLEQTEQELAMRD
ncbi:hypothetical protein M9434_006518 [Picochlorum sp. BPE23]|nr:hypothetical protein M9434_006518 [Picochlorum sp. BPE23]